MTKGNELSVMEYIDLKLIDEADSYSVKRASSVVKMAVLAACICLCVLGIWAFALSVKKADISTNVNEVAYEHDKKNVFIAPRQSSASLGKENDSEYNFFAQCSKISYSGKIYESSDFETVWEASGWSDLRIDSCNIYSDSGVENESGGRLDNILLYDQLFNCGKAILFIEPDSDLSISDASGIYDENSQSIPEIDTGNELAEICAYDAKDECIATRMQVYSDGFVRAIKDGTYVIIYVGEETVRKFMNTLK